jgi:hypothetical protein
MRIRPCVVFAGLAFGCSGAGPTTLATGQGQPAGITVRDGTVYWVDLQGAVMSVPAGGGAIVTIATGQSRPSSVAADATYVYWTNGGMAACATLSGTCGGKGDGSVLRAPRTGGAPTILAGGLCGPNGIAVDGNSAYLVDTGDGAIVKIPLAGGSPTVLAMGSFLGSLAIDSANVYFTEADSSGLHGSIVKVPIAGGAPVVLATGFAPDLTNFGCGASPPTLAVDSRNVYWLTSALDSRGASVMAVPISGGSPTALAPIAQLGENVQTPALTVDGTDAFWAGTGAFLTVPVGGGSATTIAVFEQGSDTAVGGMALDGTNLYWTTQGDGRILSTPKSP